jgi:hypothetical protein
LKRQKDFNGSRDRISTTRSSGNAIVVIKVKVISTSKEKKIDDYKSEELGIYAELNEMVIRTI